MKRVYFLDAAGLVIEDAAAARLLGSRDLSRWQNLKTTGRRREFALGRAMLSFVLREIGWRGACEPHIAHGGKPRLDGVEFSLAHSGDAFALAVGDGPLGVDIERVQEFDATTTARCFDLNERAMVAKAASTKVMATTLWCVKEAALKVHGRGIQEDPRLIPARPVGQDWKSVGMTVRTCELAVANVQHVLALAVPEEAGAPRGGLLQTLTPVSVQFGEFLARSTRSALT